MIGVVAERLGWALLALGMRLVSWGEARQALTPAHRQAYAAFDPTDDQEDR